MKNYFLGKKTQKKYDLRLPIWKGEENELLSIVYKSQFPIQEISKRPPNLWRYREAIPIDKKAEVISFNEGFTPIVKESFDGKEVQVKLEYLFPSGSYKDRGATVLMSQANFLGMKAVVQDSSGNAGVSIAQYAAKAGIKAHIFVPASTSKDKLVQAQAYRAVLHLIEGSREDTAKEAYQKAQEIYYASHVWNPFFLQGTKTFAFEVCEQNHWKAPDTVVLPAGNGTLILGAFIGFQELKNAQIIDKIPKLIGIQAQNNAPLYEAFKKGEKKPVQIIPKESLAEGIAIAEARRGEEILEAVYESQGKIIGVTEEEIKEATLITLQKGYYIEPTSGAVIAGLRKYIQNFAQENEKILSVFTGTGLKTGQKIGKML